MILCGDLRGNEVIGNSCPGVSAFIYLKVGISTSSSSLALVQWGRLQKKQQQQQHWDTMRCNKKLAFVQWGTLQLKKTTPPAGTIAGSPGHIGYWMSHLEPSLFAWKFCFIFIFQVLLNQRYQYNRISQTFHGRPGDSILGIYFKN